MKNKLVIITCFFFSQILCLHAHFPTAWPKEKLQAESDLIVVGTPLSNEDIKEYSSLGITNEIFQCIKTTFSVLKVIKSESNFKQNEITLYHYRDVKDNASNKSTESEFDTAETSTYEISRPGGPLVIRFIPQKTNNYVLYLKKDLQNRLIPTEGQLFSFDSVKKLNGKFP